MELGILLTARLVTELRDDEVARVLAPALALHLLARLGTFLGRSDGARDRPVVRLHDAPDEGAWKD